MFVTLASDIAANPPVDTNVFAASRRKNARSV
jgi:hypothetical protein